MKSMFDVEIYAMAVGAVGESSVGAIRHVLEMVTETSILHLPITANILPQIVSMHEIWLMYSVDLGIKLIDECLCDICDVNTPVLASSVAVCKQHYKHTT